MTQFQLIQPDIWDSCDQAYLADPRAYLTLQDEYGVNVNLILLAEALDNREHRLDLNQWQRLSDEISQWEQEILTPYRQLRKLSKASLTEEEYQQMLNVELMMERRAQKLILHKVNKLPPQGQQDNLCCYLALFKLTPRDFQPTSLVV